MGLLRQRAQSGYELRRQFATTPLGHYSDSPGSIYPVLLRLKTRRWAASLKEDGGPRKRTRFRLTGDGERALRRWITAPLTRDDVVWSMDEVMLRFAFLDQSAGKTEALTFLKQLEALLSAHVEELESYLAKVGPEMVSTTGRLAMESGIEDYRASLAWTRRARIELAEAGSETLMALEDRVVRSDLPGGHGGRRHVGGRARVSHAGGVHRR